MHGTDWNGPIPYDSDHPVDVDAPSLLLHQEDNQELAESVNPLDHTSQYGIELYLQTIQFAMRKVIAY